MSERVRLIYCFSFFTTERTPKCFTLMEKKFSEIILHFNVHVRDIVRHFTNYHLSGNSLTETVQLLSFNLFVSLLVVAKAAVIVPGLRIHVPQKMYPNDFGGPFNSYVAPSAG